MTDTFDSHSEPEEREWSAGNPPLGHDDPVLPNPGRGDEPEPEDEDEDDEDEPES